MRRPRKYATTSVAEIRALCAEGLTSAVSLLSLHQRMPGAQVQLGGRSDAELVAHAHRNAMHERQA